MLNLADLEASFAAEAAAHAEAAAALNPYGEAEHLNLGKAELIYSGAISPIHGVYALGLDGPPEERDWQEIERFFARKERAPNYWLTPFTDPSIRENIKHSHRLAQKFPVHGIELPTSANPEDPFTGPDLDAWSKAFGETLAFTKIHQRNTRFYLQDNQASYTFFHNGFALISFPNQGTLAQQRKESFHSKALIVMGEVDLPLLYERELYEPV